MRETSRRPRNRNQYLYVRSIGPGCWGTCPTVTQDSEWLCRKIPGAAFWTSSARTAWHCRPRWIAFPSEPLLGDQKWCNHRERGLGLYGGQPRTFYLNFCKSTWLCWPYEALHCHGAESPHGCACLVITISLLGDGWSRFASNTGHSLLFRVAESLSEVLIKEERQHNLSRTCVDGLGFFWLWWPWMPPLESLLFRFWFKVMTLRIISNHHSCHELIPFPGTAVKMINTVGHSTCFLLWLKTRHL